MSVLGDDLRTSAAAPAVPQSRFVENSLSQNAKSGGSGPTFRLSGDLPLGGALQELMNEGFGLIGFVREHDHSGTFHTRPLAEHTGEEWAERYLTKLIDGVARTLGVD